MRRRGSIAANPVLIGAATVLVVIVAVFLAYNANSGLPFVPSYQLNFQLHSAANLTLGNEVRIGGTRVGLIDKITAARGPDGTQYAIVHTKLETTVDPLPVDSTVLIRSRSALGLKYIQVTKGTSPRGYPDGGTVPLRQAVPEPVEFDDFFNMFDTKTRIASQRNLYEFGNGFAGRGGDLNRAIQDAPPLLRVLTPVAANLADRRTKLADFFTALGQTAAEVAPVGEQQASLFVNLDTTFGALAQVARPYIQEAIVNGPPAQQAAIDSFPVQRPFLANSAKLWTALQPATAALKQAAPELASAVVTGTPQLLRSPQFNKDLVPVLNSVQAFATDPNVTLGTKDLTSTAGLLNPTLAFVTPSQAVCNYWSILFRNAASLLSEGDNNGTAQRFAIIAAPYNVSNPASTINTEALPSFAPANGTDQANFLHSNFYPNTAAPGQTFECESGNEIYTVGQQVIGNQPGNQGTLHDPTSPQGSR